MSLGVSPSSSSPLTTHSRPLPPNRKRLSSSHTPSPRATRESTPLIETTASFPPTSLDLASVHESLRDLREHEDDEDLGGASRERLALALRAEWDKRDKLVAKVERMEQDRDRSEMEHKEMKVLVAGLQSRIEEAFSEQTRMEADLEERDDLLERLRKRVNEAERQARESHKRCVEQEKTFDIERQALQAQEEHLQKRILQIQSSSRSTPVYSEEDNIASLKDELASINLSHSTLLAKLNTITKELHDLKIVNKQLEEDNEGWEFLIRERTLNGQVKQGGGFLNQPESDDESDGPSLGAGSPSTAPGSPLEEELDEEMEELNSDLEAQSSIFDDEHHFVTNLDGKSDGLLAPPSKAKRRGRKSQGDGLAKSPASSVRGGLDLAAELGMVEGSDAGSVGRGNDAEGLRAEVKQLKEANKALTLYCSKIIDRIIAQDGFEHILSVDYKTRRGISISRSGSGASRPALKDIQPFANPPLPTVVPPSPGKKEKKKARPLSMMVRAISGSVETAPAMESAKVSPTSSAGPAPAAVTDLQQEAKSEKRARRGFSLDFRSLTFGSSASEPSRSALKPLTLSSRSSQPPAQRSSTVPPATSARKLEPHAEDEEDRRERHRMEATLKLMGIERTSPSPTIEEEPEEFRLPNGTFWSGKNVTKVQPSEPKRSSSSSSESGTATRKSGGTTPLSRLSSIFGSADPSSPADLITVPDPKTAEEALRAFDEREKEKIRALANGKAETGYTSPPKVGGARRGSAAEQEKMRTVSKSESVSTLWSMGGDSRPGSGEVVLKREGQ
ncbi:hypothetical protein CI109_101659 [Kwoniella shandongensis]|uniref:Uncharacterized protein n=1 Tax=Kwoniella shandongensis TaxID=1734106 RepID=A0A5M6C5M7_9TREE|nr:uncharacterized protein CI109_001217 [Kwoniella shandongensis]KAA5530414.1 hypothetical protein CI109_001217 [Kwoniella shandongensis]